jgi:hypothetical protein
MHSPPSPIFLPLNVLSQQLRDISLLSCDADSKVLQVAPQVGEVAGGPVGGADCYSSDGISVRGVWSHLPPYSIGGTGQGTYHDVCNFSCSHRFCPQPHICTTEGSHVLLPLDTAAIAYVHPEDQSLEEYSSLHYNGNKRLVRRSWNG